MAAFGVLGTHIYVGATPLTDIEASADQITDFNTLSAGVEIGLVESVGTFGKLYDLVTFQAVNTGRTYKFKGGYNQGTLEMVVASDLSDAGQLLLQGYANAQDQNVYPFKITLNGADANYDTVYFGGKVFSYQLVAGTVNNVIKANIRVEINTDVFIGAT